MEVRRAKHEDAEALANIAGRSIARLGALHYSAKQIAVWQSSFTVSGLEWIITNTEVYVVDDPAPCGVANVVPRGTDGELDLLYVDPEASGHGVARLLVETVETAARRHGYGSLWADASHLARPVLGHLGFDVIEANTKVVRGVTFDNTWMAKQLSIPQG